MAHRDWACIIGKFVISFLIYQGMLCNAPHRTQALVPLDDEDYLSGNSRIARSTSGSCRFGWDEFGDKCYKIFGKDDFQEKAWSAANSHCRYLHSTLASIHTRQEQDYLSTKFRPGSRGVWIGLHRRLHGGNFSWIDGSPLNFTEWNRGEPNSHSAGTVCVHMNSVPRGKWNDGSCRFSRAFICQSYKGAADSFVEQSSGDGEESCNREICENGGTCIEGAEPRNFQCICSSGHTGERCERSILCIHDVCENGGSCVDDADIGGIRCICADGYSGQRCEEKDNAPGFDISEYIYIIGAAAAVVSLIVIIVVVVLFKRSKKRGKNSKNSVARPTEDKSVSMSSCKRTSGQD